MLVFQKIPFFPTPVGYFLMFFDFFVALTHTPGVLSPPKHYLDKELWRLREGTVPLVLK